VTAVQAAVQAAALRLGWASSGCGQMRKQPPPSHTLHNRHCAATIATSSHQAKSPPEATTRSPTTDSVLKITRMTTTQDDQRRHREPRIENREPRTENREPRTE